MTRVLRSVTTGFLCLSIAILIGCGSSSDSDGSDNEGSGNETEIDGVAFEFTGSLQFYTVPDDAVALNIAALGASGGDAENQGATSILRGGYGAIVEMTIDVTPGDLITILVGQQPQLQVEGRDGCGASGGGGSFVVADYDEMGGGEGGASADALAVAGGGGGSSGRGGSGGLDGQDASITKDGVSSLAAQGGINGGGGGGGYSGGGGGFFNNGQDGDDLTIFDFRSRGGKSFTRGGAGGARHIDDAEECGDADGGYGGGGGGEYDSGAGGGGGYSGGAGTDDESGGGGGGSFDASNEGDISIRNQHGHGRVIIEAVF